MGEPTHETLRNVGAVELSNRDGIDVQPSNTAQGQADLSPSLEGGQKRKYPGDHGDAAARCRPRAEGMVKDAAHGAQSKLSAAGKNRDIIEWMEDQPEATGLLTCGAFSSEPFLEACCDGGTTATQPNAGHKVTRSLEYPGSPELQAEKPKRRLTGTWRAASHDPRARGTPFLIMLTKEFTWRLRLLIRI